jgi:hypothetical protein
VQGIPVISLAPLPAAVLRPRPGCYVRPVGQGALPEDRDTRWDNSSVHEFTGSYGQYLLGKVGKVFPALRRLVATDGGGD